MVCNFVREDLDVFVAVDLGVCFSICKFFKDPYLMTRKKFFIIQWRILLHHHVFLWVIITQKYYQNVNSVINN